MANLNRQPLTPEEAMQTVFGNDLLVEMILEMVTRSNLGFPQNDTRTSNKETPKRSTTDILSLRQVCKSWNFVVSKLHRKSPQQPLFHLPLTHDNYSGLLAVDNGTCPERREEGTLLTLFSTAMSSWGYRTSPNNYNLGGDSPSNEKYRPIPPFHLSLTPSFFTVANAPVYEALYTFLRTYGPESMTRFTFKFCQNRYDFIPTVYPTFSLDRLTYVQLVIERMAWSFIPFIQHILKCSPNLQTLDLTSSSCIITYSPPHLRQIIGAISRSRPYSLRLPESTRKILYYGTTDSCSCFYRVPVDNLVNLETLALAASSCIISQMDDIFEHVAGRLRHLHLIGFSSCAYSFNRNYQLSFKPMPKLESLTVIMPWELKPGLWFQYSTRLPSLKELTVIHHDQSDDAFIRFLDNGKESLTMERCTMIAVKPHIHNDNGFRTTSQRLYVTRSNILHGINDCFPNLTHLGIGVTGEYTEGLKYILSWMTSLKSLAIYVECNFKFKTSICWDSIFTGLSDVACDSLGKNDVPGYWDSIVLLDDKYPSIRDMKNLEALYLIETSYPSCRVFSSGAAANNNDAHGLCDFDRDTLPCKMDHLFSELSFHFAFFQMPNLKMLACTSGFMPSEQTQEKWLAEKGLKIKNMRSPKPYHFLTAKFSVFDNAWYYN